MLTPESDKFEAYTDRMSGQDRYAVKERAAILEYLCNMPRWQAE